jgi:hypothetical protein
VVKDGTSKKSIYIYGCSTSEALATERRKEEESAGIKLSLSQKKMNKDLTS